MSQIGLKRMTKSCFSLDKLNCSFLCEKKFTKKYASSAREAITKNSFNHCVELVKTNDYDLYLSTLLSPESVMRASFAVKAFNIELLSIGKSRETNLSIMKLQFWKDQLDKIFNESKDDQADSLKLSPQEVYLRNRNLNLFEVN